MSDNNYYVSVPKRLVREFEGDVALAFWYSALKDYMRRFRPDRLGFTRVATSLIEQELGLDRFKVRRLNKKLEERQLITVDKRPGAKNMGFKLRVLGMM